MKIKKNLLWIFAIAVTSLAFAASVFLWADRMDAEKEYKAVQMVINYDDIEAFANANDLSIEAFIEELQKRGASVVLFKEMSIEDLARQGKIDILMGQNVKNETFADQLSKEIVLKDSSLYVCFLDKNIEMQSVENILHKVEGATYYQGDVSCVEIPTMIPNSAQELNGIMTRINGIGVGFDHDTINLIASLGMDILPQVRSWENANVQAMRYVLEKIKEMPNLYGILFNDKEVIGYPNDLRIVADLLKDAQGKPLAPLGSIEFSEQKGLSTLAVLMEKNVFRLHTISNGEMAGYENIDSAMDRWMLGVRERNMRALFVRFFDVYTPQTSLSYNMEYLETLQSALLADGFTLGGDYQQSQSVGTQQLFVLICGLGVAGGVMMMLLYMGLRRLAVAGFLAVIVCWGGLFMISPIMARKLMALAAVIVYPTLGCVVMMKPKRSSVTEAMARVLAMSLISFLGAVFMVGLLADALFMMKLDGFVGVKIAHLVPLLAVPFILYIYNGGMVKNIKELLATAMTYKWVVIGLVVAVAGIVYISRTGNTSGELSVLESTMRSALNDWLGVRPRSKEFLIGYPFALLLFYIGASRKNWVFTLPAIIGQVSLVNTYAHIHTPLLISLERSFNGLALGLVIGLLLIAVYRIGEKLWRKYII